MFRVFYSFILTYPLLLLANDDVVVTTDDYGGTEDQYKRHTCGIGPDKELDLDNTSSKRLLEQILADLSLQPPTQQRQRPQRPVTPFIIHDEVDPPTPLGSTCTWLTSKPS